MQAVYKVSNFSLVSAQVRGEGPFTRLLKEATGPLLSSFWTEELNLISWTVKAEAPSALPLWLNTVA